MRIVLATEGSTGDVHPMLFLGEALLEVGHQVTICGPSDFEPDARARKLEFVAASGPAKDAVKEVAVALHAGGFRLLRESRKYTNLTIETQFRVLPDVVRDADLVLGAGLQFAAPSIAELHGVPYRYVAYCPVLLESAEHPPFLIEKQDMPGWMNTAAWRALRLVYNLADRPGIDRHRHKLGLPPLVDAYRYFLGSRLILAADEALSPAPRDCRQEITQIPALVGTNRSPLPERVLEFLERPCIYIGFGSMPDPHADRTTRQLLEVVKRAGVRAILHSGWAELGQGDVPPEVLVVGSISHAELFPRVSLLVHHGGAGTTTTAMRAGRPQVIVPHLLDQFYHGHRVHQLGLGPRPHVRRSLDPAALALAIRQTLDDPRMAERATEIAARPRISLHDSLRATIGNARTLRPEERKRAQT